MSAFKSLEWYKKHPEIVARHHGQRWSDLHIHILLLLYKEQESLEEMTRMLGRTEYGVLAQLVRQKMIWRDSRSFQYFKRCPGLGKRFNLPQLYNGKNCR